MKKIILALLITFYATTGHAYVATVVALGECMFKMAKYYQDHKEDIKNFEKSAEAVTKVGENLVTLATHAYQNTSQKLSKLSLPISLGSFSNTKHFTNLNAKLSEIEKNMSEANQKLDKIDAKIDVLQGLVEKQSEDLKAFYQAMDANQNTLKESIEKIQVFLNTKEIDKFKLAVFHIQEKYFELKKSIDENRPFEEKNDDIKKYRDELLEIAQMINDPNSTSLLTLEQKNILYLFIALSYQYGELKDLHRDDVKKYLEILLQLPTQKEAIDQRIKTKSEELDRLNKAYESNFSNKVKRKEIGNQIDKEEALKVDYEKWAEILDGEDVRISYYRELARSILEGIGVDKKTIQEMEQKKTEKIKSFELEAALFLVRNFKEKK